MKPKQLSHFEPLAILGEGTHGKVIKALNKQNGQVYALKIVKKINEEQGFSPTAFRQAMLLRELQHPDLIKLIDLIPIQGQLVLVLEYVENDLKKILKSQLNETLPLWQIKSYTYQMLRCLNFLHANRVWHRDFKPENLLIGNTKKLKVTDLGLALNPTYTSRPLCPQVVSLTYRAPELLLGSRKYDEGIDIWAVGCVLAEMLTSKILFAGKNEEEQLYCIFQLLGAPSQNTCPELTSLPLWNPQKFALENSSKLQIFFSDCSFECVDLLKKMLELNPKNRIKAIDALNHPFFNSMVDEFLN